VQIVCTPDGHFCIPLFPIVRLKYLGNLIGGGPGAPGCPGGPPGRPGCPGGPGCPPGGPGGIGFGLVVEGGTGSPRLSALTNISAFCCNVGSPINRLILRKTQLVQ